MPQMNPMNWLYLFTFMGYIMYSLYNLTYFININNSMASNNKFKKMMKNIQFKW